MHSLLRLTGFIFAASWLAGGGIAAQPPEKPVIPDRWMPLGTAQVRGVYGKRLRLWRQRRLWRVAEHPLLLSVFEGGPGGHAYARGSGREGQGESSSGSSLWLGEHAGKWLHATTLAYEATGDEKLPDALRRSVARLIAAQEESGYLGTYAPEKRYYAPPDKDTWRSWDVWTQRYCLYGLLSYERFHPDDSVVQACTRIGDLLYVSFGPGRRDITSIGTRHGMSSTTVLESVVMLYARTGEKRFLDLGEAIVRASEKNPKLRLLGSMLDGVDVSVPGDGKAYQLMANLLGFGELYRFTGNPKYLRAAVKGWENILTDHLYESGGPWTYASERVKNQECFAPPDQFLPSNVVETCSATTWIQLSLQLLRLTGESRYAAEAERALLNQIFAAQAPDGVVWATHPPANGKERRPVSGLDCCASSGPRALEMYARHLVGISDRVLSLATYLPMKVDLRGRLDGVTSISMTGRYPFEDRAVLRLMLPKPLRLTIDFVVPRGADSLDIIASGKALRKEKTPAGFLRVDRIWRPGERIEVRFAFPLQAHVHQGRDGRQWAAFSWGPTLLARKFASGEAPEAAITASAVRFPERWIKRVSSGNLRFRTRDGTTFISYASASSEAAGVQTYFPIPAEAKEQERDQ